MIILKSTDDSNVDEELGSGTTTTSNTSEEVYCNPWALKCHRDHLKKIGLFSPGPSTPPSLVDGPSQFVDLKVKSQRKKPQNYLLLENLVSKYKYPCVLDLKVGTRQYADDVSAAKKARKIAKAQNTTSATLGLRLTGMQVHFCLVWAAQGIISPIAKIAISIPIFLKIEIAISIVF